MAYRLLHNTEERIIDAIQSIGAHEGIQNVTAIKIAKMCDISNFTAASCFGNMRNALDMAAKQFDQLYMAKSEEMAGEGLNIEQIWDKTLEYFFADPDGTLYYNAYTQYFGFDPTEKNERSTEFLHFAVTSFQAKNQLSDHEYLMLWDYITSMAFYYSEKFIRGYLEFNDENRRFVKKIVFGGLDKLLGTGE